MAPSWAALALALLALAGCAGLSGAPTVALEPPPSADEPTGPATSAPAEAEADATIGTDPTEQAAGVKPVGQGAGTETDEQVAEAEAGAQVAEAEAGAQVAAHTAGLELATPLPQPKTSWLDLGIEYLNAGDLERARAAFIRSVRIEGTTAAALTGAGVAAEQQGLLTEARRHFEQARILAPESVVVYNNLGAVLFRLDELEAARAAFRTALALSSGANGIAARNLGITELAIRRAQAGEPQLAANPITVRRTGSSTFRLMPRAAPPEQG